MKNKRFIYLAKLGIIETNDEQGNYEIQRIDSPTDFENSNDEIDFTPPYLSSDAEAKELFKSLTHSQLDAVSGWVCTDPDCNQYRKDISETVFLFEEERKNPFTKEISLFELEIDINQHEWDDIVQCCASFGYTTYEVGKWLHEKENLDLIAECLFEMS